MLSFRNRRRPGFGTRGNPARAARLGPAGCWFLPSGAEPTILCFPRPAPRAVDRAPSRPTLICALGRYADVFLDWHLANLPTSNPGLGMIKSELIKRIASQNSHLYQRDIENIVNAIIDEIVKALGRGDRVELRGFGAFSAKIRGAHKGRNPRTGAEVQVAQRVLPFFKTGKEMRARLNRETARSGD